MTDAPFHRALAAPPPPAATAPRRRPGQSQPRPASGDLSFGDIGVFLAIAFGLSWGVVGLILAMPELIEAWFGPLSITNPLFFLAVYAPAIAALTLVAFRAGPAGLRRFCGRVLLFKVPGSWIAWIAIGIPALYFGAALLVGAPLASGPEAMGTPLLLAIGLMLVLGPVEELGWRGALLPLLQRRMAPLWAGLVVGMVWSVWHLPAFLLSGTPQSGWDILPFMIGATAVSVIMTACFNATGGSILWMALFHFQLNNPLWPDAQPLDMYLFAAAALGTIVLNRDAMFGRRRTVTRVIP